MTNPSLKHFNDIYQDAAANVYRLDAMEYKSEHDRAMALRDYRDFINVLDTTKQDTRREIAKNLLAMGLDIEAIVKATGLTEEMILQ